MHLDLNEILEVMLNLEPYRLILRAEVVQQKAVRLPARFAAEVALNFFAYAGEDHEELLVRYIMQEQINRQAVQ